MVHDIVGVVFLVIAGAISFIVENFFVLYGGIVAFAIYLVLRVSKPSQKRPKQQPQEQKSKEPVWTTGLFKDYT